jgi:hypothetical protein
MNSLQPGNLTRALGREISRLTILIIFSVVCCSWAEDATGTADSSPGQVIITQRAIRHIEERHWPDSPAQGAGKFNQGITEDSLRELVNEAVAKGRVRPNTNGRPGEIYEYDFGRPIGTTIQGGPASRLRVVVSPRNQVITAFPF